MECSKTVFIEESANILKEKDLKRNISRISVMSGVHRRDVARIQEYGIQLYYEQDLISKVLGQWQNGAKYCTKAGTARVLQFEGENSEFANLVHSVSRDMNPSTVLFELERINAIERTSEGIRLVIESYVPKGDPLKGFTILSNDTDDLTQVVEENVLQLHELPQFHARTEYDNVRPEALPEIKRWFLKEGHEFHAKVRSFVSQFDQDISPDPSFSGRGAHVSFSAFSRIKGVEKK